tara:strand:+ start:269 stop:550 length:282 start_codon:yes stop_codon:yes gene_type:complete
MCGRTERELKYEGGQTVVWSPALRSVLEYWNQKVVARFACHLTPNGSKLYLSELKRFSRFAEGIACAWPSIIDAAKRLKRSGGERGIRTPDRR